MDYPARRREQVARVLPEEGLDALLVSSPVNVTYLTGFSGDSSVLALARDRNVLVSDRRFTEQLAEECPGLETHIRPPSQKLPEAVAEVLTRLGFRSVGFETGSLTVAEFEALKALTPAVNWKGGDERVEKLRAVKDESEVARIREAIRIAERGFAAFRALLRPEDSEKDLCDAMESHVRRAGGQGSSFPPIVAVGERAALPHAPPTGRVVGSAELLLVDWGATGPTSYKSDLTRVLDTRTKSDSRAVEEATKLEEVYAVVLRAQEAALRAVRPGATGRDVDAAARKVIADAGFGDYFGHGLGHGIGLQIHEAPAVRPNSDAVLQAAMVITLEPGIYLPGWGGVRIEDDVLVTPDGAEVLTHVPKQLEEMRVFA
jgi:Xaa-Pro aminopeptidase